MLYIPSKSIDTLPIAHMTVASGIVTTTYDYIIIAHDHSPSLINILSHHNLSLSAIIDERKHLD